MQRISIIYISALFSVVLCFISALLFFEMVSSSLDNRNYVVLVDPEQIYNLTQHGGRPTYNITGVWEVPDSAISELLAVLPLIESRDFVSLQGASKISESTDEYYYQFSGVNISGIRYIHINAVYKDNTVDHIIAKYGRQHAMMFSDGGGYYWSAIYQPSTEQFKKLYTNGVN